MNIYYCATGLCIISDNIYVLGDYIDGCGTIVKIEKKEEETFTINLPI